MVDVAKLQVHLLKYTSHVAASCKMGQRCVSGFVMLCPSRCVVVSELRCSFFIVCMKQRHGK